MKKIVYAVSSMLLCSFFLFSCDSENINTSTVEELDLNRYAGERNLTGCTAMYTLNGDGTIKVINAGYKNSLDGKYQETEGKARRPNDAEPGKLEVAFFLNFYADYYVLELADDYRYSLVGSKKSKYLWILSRTPQMDAKDLDFVLKSAENRGYDTNKLIWVEQKEE